jgi:hypothetical protein
MSRHERKVGSASRVVRAGKQIPYRFLQRFICKVMALPRRLWTESQEANNFDRIVSNANAPVASMCDYNSNDLKHTWARSSLGVSA